MHNQPREPALWGLSSKINSRIWVNLSRNGLRLSSRHQEPPHTDVSRNLSTVVVSGVLPGLREEELDCCPVVQSHLFRWEQVLYFIWIQGPRVWRKGGEAQSPSCLKSSVKFSQSVMIWGAMSSAGVDPLCYLKTNVTAPVYQEILEHFMLSSADQLVKYADFIFQQDLAPAHTAKSTKSWCAWLASKLTWPEPHREYMEYLLSRGKWETRDQKMQMNWRPLSKKPGLPHHLSSATNWSPPCHAELRQ